MRILEARQDDNKSQWERLIILIWNPQKRENAHSMHARFWSTRSGLLGHLVHHFHIGHNAPGLPPKVCITIVFNFSWDACNTQQKLGKIWCGAGGEGREVNKLYYGLYEIGEDALKTSKFIKYIWFFRKFTLVTIQLFRGWRNISTQDVGYNERDFASWQLNLKLALRRSGIFTAFEVFHYTVHSFWDNAQFLYPGYRIIRSISLWKESYIVLRILNLPGHRENDHTAISVRRKRKQILGMMSHLSSAE